jgi:hypothetical protein
MNRQTTRRAVLGGVVGREPVPASVRETSFELDSLVTHSIPVPSAGT